MENKYLKLALIGALFINIFLVFKLMFGLIYDGITYRYSVETTSILPTLTVGVITLLGLFFLIRERFKLIIKYLLFLISIIFGALFALMMLRDISIYPAWAEQLVIVTILVDGFLFFIVYNYLSVPNFELEKSKLSWFFVIVVFLSFSLFYLISNYGLGWQGWGGISTLALIGTGIAIGYQAYYTRKYVEVSAMPCIYFGLRSERLKNIEDKYEEKIRLAKKQSREEKKLKREMEKEKETINKLPIKEKIRTYFIVRNNSNYPILFNVKINYEINGKIIDHPDEGYWEGRGREPLHIFPPGMKYPDVINLKNVSNLENLMANSESIIAHIKYRYTPRFASKIIKYGPFQENWTYYLKESRWRGPQSVKEENLNI